MLNMNSSSTTLQTAPFASFNDRGRRYTLELFNDPRFPGVPPLPVSLCGLTYLYVLSSLRVWHMSDPYGISHGQGWLPAFTLRQVTRSFPPVRRFRVAQSHIH